MIGNIKFKALSYTIVVCLLFFTNPSSTSRIPNNSTFARDSSRPFTQKDIKQNPCPTISTLSPDMFQPVPENNPPPKVNNIQIAYMWRTMDFYHNGIDSSVHIVDQMASPSIGSQRFYFPAMTVNLKITADGVTLNYTLGSDLTSSSSIYADVFIPSGTTLLKMDYDQLDSAIAFEGLWYLAYDWVWGPLTMTIHLPTDAVINRYEGASYATALDEHTLQFVIPNGTSFYSTVVYSTTNVPNLYDMILTPHFRIFIPTVYKQYDDIIVSLLENAYVLYSQYSGQDVNKLANQARYDYYFPPGGWYWWGSTIVLWGGLTVLGGPSAVSSRFIPDSKLSVEAINNNLVGIMYHELGNGWWLLMSNGGLPWWINGEGHSSFLRSQAELDIGYCGDAQSQELSHYQSYLQCQKAQPPNNHCGEDIIIISLLQKYGWQPFRNIYASVWNGSLNLNGLSDAEKDSQMILFFSQQVRENLAPFFATQGIFASSDVQNELNRLPTGNVPIISTLICHPLAFHYTPIALQFNGIIGQQNPESRTIYVSSPTSWTATVSPEVSWLSFTRSSGDNITYLTININILGLQHGLYSTTLILSSDTVMSNSPAEISITLLVGYKIYAPFILSNTILNNLVQNPGFEDGLYDPNRAPSDWVRDSWMQSSTLIWDNQRSHSGSKSVRIDSLTANDARWLQERFSSFVALRKLCFDC